jgi:hypothetical protein
MLVAINPNDKRYLNHQHNVIPVAQARNLGVIAMKVFADGAIYDKEARWSQTPGDVVRRVGSRDIPSRPLVEYALTTPGIHTAIIGTGQISDNHLECQLVQNFYAAQIEPDGMSEKERLSLEERMGGFKEGRTNYFQLDKIGLTPPADLAQGMDGTGEITWNSALADEAPLSHYEVFMDGTLVASVPHVPQITMEPFRFDSTVKGSKYKVVTVDRKGNRAESREMVLA